MYLHSIPHNNNPLNIQDIKYISYLPFNIFLRVEGYYLNDLKALEHIYSIINMILFMENPRKKND